MKEEFDYELAADIAKKRAETVKEEHETKVRKGKNLVMLAFSEGKITKQDIEEIASYFYWSTIASCCETADDVERWISRYWSSAE